MMLCSDNHQAVAFDGNECPVCNMQIDMQKLQMDFMIEKNLHETAKSEIEELKANNCYLEKEIEELKKEKN